MKVALEPGDLGGQCRDLRREFGDLTFLGGDRGHHPRLVRRQPSGQRDQRAQRLPGLRRQRAVPEQAGQVPPEFLDRTGIGRHAHSPSASTAINAARTARRSARGIALYRRPQPAAFRLTVWRWEKSRPASDAQ